MAVAESVDDAAVDQGFRYRGNGIGNLSAKAYPSDAFAQAGGGCELPEAFHEGVDAPVVRSRVEAGEFDRAAYAIAAFVASCCDLRFKAFRHRLQAAGKPLKVAITSCARKLLTILNTMVRLERGLIVAKGRAKLRNEVHEFLAGEAPELSPRIRILVADLVEE
ncbi:hypothetical protein [Sphingomonas sp.]|uniref:hypothetical protein n=1 Tax=Sphingomonas sp. TaxID=28214 RepID=UPI003FA7986F